MRIFRSPCLSALLAALPLLLLPLQAQACSCGRAAPDELLSSTDLAFKGRVTRAEPVDPLGPSADEGSAARHARRSIGMRGRFRVDTLWKGPAADEVEVEYSERNGSNCGWSFRVDEEVTVFANKTHAGSYVTSGCTMRLVAYPPARGGASNEDLLKSYAATLDGLEQRLRANPADLPALRERGALYARYRDHDRAEAAFTRLLALAPRDLAGLLGRADVRHQTRQYAAALADFDLALAVSPRHPQAQKGRTMTLVHMARAGQPGQPVQPLQLGPLERDFSGFRNHGPISLAGLDLQGASFQGAQLDTVDFTGADLRGADFSGADLRKVDFTAAQLAWADFNDLKNGQRVGFKGAAAAFASFRKARFSLVQFDGAVLTGADFEGAWLHSASFKGATLRGANMVKALMSGADLSSIEWDGEDLSGADLIGANMSGAALRRVSLRRAQLGASAGFREIGDWRGTDLSEADLAYANWGPILTDCRTRFPKGTAPQTLPLLPLWGPQCPGAVPATALKGGTAHQQGPRLDKTQAQGSRLAGRDLSGFAFWRAVMDGSDLRGANLAKADIQLGSWAGVRFDNAALVEARLSGVDFKDASFQGADLGGARLDNVDLSHANLQSAKLRNTCFDARTVWPDGFDAVEGGARRC